MKNNDWLNTLKLLRIPFSLFLMPVFLLALSQAENIETTRAIWVFIILHLLVYPSSNGYNSYVDKDETPIGGLEKPPQPTKLLLYFTFLLDFFALLFSYIYVSGLFSLCVFVYILASRAYSSPSIRLKKYPILGFLVVVIFQGAFTYYMAKIAVEKYTFDWNINQYFMLLATSLQIAGAYPLTQIYQHEADLKDGVVTISYRLGYLGTFYFTAFMFMCCNIFYYFYFSNTLQINAFYILQACFLPVISFFLYWYLKVNKNYSNANFQNTMRMNLIASLSMIIFSSILFIKKML